ncbi:MAG: chemotaxis protein CheX [Planctomycetaceae bacterium]|nr:chemotaxis protein CheX [Planctomycetaceae bacterium]
MIEQICLNDLLLDSAKEIFGTMIFMDLVEVKELDPKDANWDLLGSITFKGGIEGCLAICCTKPCAQAVAVNMLALDSPDELTEDGTYDAIGEIANMVMGCLKARILKLVGTLEVSIPSVVSGHELRNTLGDHSTRVSVKVCIDDKYNCEFLLTYREKSK